MALEIEAKGGKKRKKYSWRNIDILWCNRDYEINQLMVNMRTCVIRKKTFIKKSNIYFIGVEVVIYIVICKLEK